MGEAIEDGGQSVLHLNTPADGHQPGCGALPADAGAWLWITYDGEGGLPANHPPGRPDRMGHLVVGDHTRSADGMREPDGSAPVVVDAVTDPTDLERLGTAIGRSLRRWEDDDLAICFDSVTALLDHVDEKSAIKFLHLLVERLERADAVVHFHLDAAAHDDATIGAVAELVDAVEGPHEQGRHAGDKQQPDEHDRPSGDKPTHEDVHERLQRATDGGEATDDAGDAPERSPPAEVDEATDQDVADAYADHP
ncbi:MAG: DUF7504 family protein [archaeon]